MKVLILGADGFIGRHIAFYMRDQGVEVLAHARNTRALAAMGFATLRADLTDPACHSAAFWAPHLPPGCHLINAAGLLTGTGAAFRAVHETAPAAVMQALSGGRAVHISAVGLEADTPFAHWRRKTEAVFAGHTVLRAGLVMADTSYGGSSLLRALAVLPFVTPVVGPGTQPFNPLHANDLAAVVHDCLTTPPKPGIWEIGGPETLTQAALVQRLTGWMGLAPRRILPLPLGLARAMGWLGDVFKLGPVSATAVAQLQAGVIANPRPLLERISSRPRGASAFIPARPAGTQDLWHARLYLLKPLIRLVLAVMWLGSAALGLCTDLAGFLPALPGVDETLATVLARGGGALDGAIGVALLFNWRPRTTAFVQIAVVLAYTAGLSVMAPALWLDPFGGLLKNLPVLALLLAHLALAEER